MFQFYVRKCMTQQNEQQRNRMLSLLREGERRMLVQLAGLLRTSVDEINAELEKEELLSALEQPITVEYLNGVVQHHLFERLHKGDMVAAQRMLNQYQSDLEAMMRQETRQDDTPPEEVKAQA
ncbi:hypothetical protein GVO02_12680 [Aeromonas caviae]|nr:hypothetical protein C2U30_10630 [Aeromonas sp. ASNIH5]AUU23438.1 hypothetical protein MC60_016640 [Aeromonas caviae]AUV16240.1 hypothetical protein C2U47_05995 [Aeromonas sp. ASNIH7]AUY09291.1 hypothetical protein C3F36_06765 [Aeromonas sp. ASNIH2]AUZ80107.1 hypothetical protein C2U37_10910 [Aeromonas sp. ASNIH1]POV92089.1 hypothetical protein C3418_09255 [Aeromonas sp. ASNIH8]PZQ98807.1 MAG: hypothetical protein DI541_08125 [Aeromonas media]RDD51653.1 hypothetical protein ASJ36_03425 [A